MLLQTTADLKAYLGGAIALSADSQRMVPYITLATEKYLDRVFGAAFVESLAVEAPLSAKQKVLRAKLARALAFYAYLEFLPYSLGSEGDNGLQEIATERTTPARLAVLNDRKLATAENAAQALETALLYLFGNAADFSAWTDSDEAKALRGLYINTGTLLGLAVPATGGSYRLLVTLQPYLEEAERTELPDILGDAYAQTLETAYRNNTLSAAQTALLPYLRRLVGNVAYKSALLHLNVVQQPGGGLRVLSEFDGIHNFRAATDEQIAAVQRAIDEKIIQHRGELRRYLTKNAGQLTGYTPPSDTIQRLDNSDFERVFVLR